MELRDLREIFEKNGHKFTKQRQIIFEALNKSVHKHLTPEELFSIVHEENPSIGIATVYRTLNIFEKLGIVQKQEFRDSINRYELIGENDHHDHFICKKCGKIYEGQMFSVDKLTKYIKENYDFTMDDYTFKAYGLCSDCKNKKE
ncbi:MAG: Fur family transcriptional regulator [Tissierellia bacterium]|nr:Fur family transcriptional regulator [Tissierellia bacterium]